MAHTQRSIVKDERIKSRGVIVDAVVDLRNGRGIRCNRLRVPLGIDAGTRSTVGGIATDAGRSSQTILGLHKW